MTEYFCCKSYYSLLKFKTELRLKTNGLQFLLYKMFYYLFANYNMINYCRFHLDKVGHSWVRLDLAKKGWI